MNRAFCREPSWGWKAILAFAAFYAFCFGVREHDKQAFDQTAPQFLIRTSEKDSMEFFLANGIARPVYFKGIEGAQHLDSTWIDSIPVKYTALPAAGLSNRPDSTFRIRLRKALGPNDTLRLYWSDASLDIYLVKVAKVGTHYFCELPLAQRSTGRQSLYNASWNDPRSWIQYAALAMVSLRWAGSGKIDRICQMSWYRALAATSSPSPDWRFP